MKCPKCSHLNEDNARFCNSCGFNLTEKKQDWYSIFLLAYCTSILFFSILYLILKSVFQWTDASWQTVNIIYIILAIIQSLLALIIPLGIRTLWMKIVAFVVVGLAAIINIIQNIIALKETINSDF